jgi:hypothetical protein
VSIEINLINFIFEAGEASAAARSTAGRWGFSCSESYLIARPNISNSDRREGQSFSPEARETPACLSRRSIWCHP